MPDIDFSTVASAALGMAEQLLAEWLPDGKLAGGEWTALNPTRADGRAGSFKVNIRTGAWSDFATGDAGGDLVSLYAYLFTGGKQGDAARAVAKRCGVSGPGARKRSARKSAPPEPRKDGKHAWTPVLPVPDGAGDRPVAHYRYGRPSVRWAYRDREGRLLGYVCRFDRHGRDKEVLPLTWCRNEKGEEGWQWRAFDVPRPLYGLDRLTEYPSIVLVVEGEKCADAFLGHYKIPVLGHDEIDLPIVTWPGGSKAVRKADWAPLAGREVILWPDNDEPGFGAMREAAGILAELRCTVRVVRPPEDALKAWDIADAIDEGWSIGQISALLREAASPAQVFGDGGGGAGRGKTPHREKNAPAASALGYRQTDSGAALDLVDLFGDELRYNAKPFSKWFVYDGTRWLEDRTNLVFGYLDRLIQRILEQASKLPSADDRKPLEKWVFKLEGMSRQKAVVAKAETIQDIAVRVEDFDRNDWRFNCANVTLDLEAGEVKVRDHDPDDYITMLSPVVYNPAAKCPRWESFLARIFNGDQDLISFMQRAVGYSLTGDMSEQKLFFAFGTGANGKTVFFETIRYVMGDYAGKAPTEMLMQQQYNQIPTDVADLRGKRFVVASEVDDGRRWAEARIKDLTGGDTMKARRMREDFFEFRPTHKLWVFGNHKPTLRGTDAGIKRRLRIIPFVVQIPKEEQDPLGQLLATLRGEASGILNWALAGYQRWWEAGLGSPAAIDEATQDYFDDNDILLNFIRECCVELRGVSTNGQDLWKKYHGWCDSQGIRSLATKGFYRVLEEKGYTKRVGTGNKTVIDDLAIRDDGDDS